MFAPAFMLAQWGIKFPDASALVGRRAAALHAGIGVMFLLGRNAGPSPARSALIAGIVTALLLLAGLGVVVFAIGRADTGILGDVALEVGIAIAFLCVPSPRKPPDT